MAALSAHDSVAVDSGDVPTRRSCRRPETVPAGVPMRSAPIVTPQVTGSEGTTPKRCSAFTAQHADGDLEANAPYACGPDVRHDGRSVIRMHFEIDQSARREAMDLSRIACISTRI